MDRLSFFRAVLGAGGHYCLFAAREGRRKQKFYPTLEQLSKAADEFDAAEYDVYFALATFAPGADRKAENAEQLGALFLDLDCGPKKEYPDQVTAIAALRQFVTDLHLPKPIVVSSGWGIHVYWPLAEAVSRSEWLPVAEALKRACAARGLHADPAITADAARILRVPGSRNFKRETPAPVQILGIGTGARPELAEMARRLADYAAVRKEILPTASVPGLSAADDPVMQRLMGNRSFSMRRILEKTAQGRGCAQLGFAVSQPAEVSEPLWRGALSITKFCTEGRTAAHRISRGHPEYDAEQTDAKFDAIKGPYTCATMDGLRPGVCSGCPHWNKLKSPILLGASVEEAPTSEPDGAPAEDEDEKGGVAEPAVVYLNGHSSVPAFPFPYFRGKHGGVYIKQKNEDGDPEEICVYMNDLYYTRRVVDPEYGECVIGRLNLPNDGTREFVVPLVASTSKEELRKALAKYGVSVPTKRWDALMAYTNAWVEKLQVTTMADTARTQFGWSDNSFKSYILGDREIFADKVGYNPPSSKTAFLFPALKPRGTLEGWVKQAEFYNRPGLEPYQYVICHALAAPLMRFLPVHAAIFDFYSDGSGHGKSTTQKFALTIYGNPQELIVGPKDTLNARMNRLELMKDVNVQFDEFTEFPAEDASDLIYGITDGRQKARLRSGSNDERHRGEPWHTTVCSSSNHSMLAKVYLMKSNPRAEVQRVLRYHVQPHNFTEKTETDLFAKSVGDNTGHAIVPFVQRIMADTATAKQLIETVQKRIDTACGLTMQNRFWSVQGAVTIAALVLARDLGLLSYDPAKLFDWVVALINDNKANDRESVTTVESLINDFVNDNYGNILWIKSTDDARGGNNNGLDKLVLPEMQPKMTLAARYETDTKQLAIPYSTLKTWCAKKRINFDSVFLELKEKMGAYKKHMRLSKGTKLALPATVAIVMNFSALSPEDPDGPGAAK
jgi:hypothetical protein